MSITYLNNIENYKNPAIMSEKTEADIPSNVLAEKQAKMLMAILNSFSILLATLSHQEELNSQISQGSITAAEANYNEAKTQETKLEQALYKKEHSPWWKSLLNVVVKYVLPVVMCVVALLTFGMGSALVCGAAVAVSMSGLLDPNTKQGFLGRLLMDASNAIGKTLGIDPNIVMTVLTTVVITAATAGAGAFASTTTIAEAAETTAETVVNDATEMTEGAENIEMSEISTTNSNPTTNQAELQTKVDRFNTASKNFVRLNTMTSLTSASNPGYYLALSILDSKDPHMSDDKKKAIAELCSAIFNLIVGLTSMMGGFSTMKSAGDLLGNVGKISQTLGNVTNLYKALNGGNLIVNLLNSAATIYQGTLQTNTSNILAELQKLLAQIKFAQGFDKTTTINQNSLDTQIRSSNESYISVIQSSTNWAVPYSAEAQAIISA